MSFNLAQLATLDQAKELAAQINATKFANGTPEGVQIGGGILPYSETNAQSGIYLPDWLTNTGSEPPSETNPEGQREFYYHFRFRNGVEGVNVGLILDMLQRHWTAPMYVLKLVFDEVESLARFTGKRR